jgi:hypothetical protein
MTIWLGKAFCIVKPGTEQFNNGNRGAYAVFVCKASEITECCRLISMELAENHLEIRGFEWLVDKVYADRATTDYEDELIERLETYPVQFENVHYFKGDS